MGVLEEFSGDVPSSIAGPVGREVLVDRAPAWAEDREVRPDGVRCIRRVRRRVELRDRGDGRWERVLGLGRVQDSDRGREDLGWQRRLRVRHRVRRDRDRGDVDGRVTRRPKKDR